MSVSTTAIYRHVHQPKYILMPMCVEKQHGFCTAWGKLLHLSEKDVRVRGLSIVLRDLEEFPSRDGDVQAEVNGFSEEAKHARRVLRDYWQVGITLNPGPTLELQPMLDLGKDRGIGEPEDCFTISLPSTPVFFFEMLTKAFDKCCVVEDK